MLTLLPLVLFLLLILWIFVFPAKRAAASATDAEVASGVQWLQEQEAHSPRRRGSGSSKAIRQAERMPMPGRNGAQKLYSGEISVWSLFEDYAMLGDSRTSGFTYYGYLAPERVFADSGATIKKVIDHLEELVALNPSIIFLTYGINDVGIGYWPTPEDYVNEINNTLALLKEHLPNATVYVCSIIPPLNPRSSAAPAWREIPDYNDAVRAFCEENGTPYVDITQLCEEHTDLYQDDGVHLLGGFYPLWGTELIAEVYDDVFALESNESAAE